MSKFEWDDPGMPGYFLPEESQFRLKKLHEYVRFLSHLAQPRIADEEMEGVPEIRVGEVAICLELLAEQLEQVLDELSWPAERREAAAAPAPAQASAPASAPAPDVAPEAVEAETAKPVPAGADKHYLFGVTLDQIDELNLLTELIQAHGDVVIASHDAEFAEYTLSVLGHAIVCDVEKLRAIIDDVQSQRLGKPHAPWTGVEEEHAVYRIEPVPLAATRRRIAHGFRVEEERGHHPRLSRRWDHGDLRRAVESAVACS